MARKKKPKYVLSVFMKADRELTAKEKRNVRNSVRAALMSWNFNVSVKHVSEVSSADAYKF